MKTFLIRESGEYFRGHSFPLLLPHCRKPPGVSFDKVVIDLPYDMCQSSIRHSCKEMFLNNFPSIGGMMKCYKGAVARRH